MQTFRTITRARPLVASALALALAACTVGPDFVRPDVAVPDAFGQPAPAPANVDGVDETPPVLAADPAFWRGFDDPQLTALVEQALAANHDLRIALANFDRANALLRGSKFDSFPTLTASAEGSDNRASRITLGATGVVN